MSNSDNYKFCCYLKKKNEIVINIYIYLLIRYK